EVDDREAPAGLERGPIRALVVVDALPGGLLAALLGQDHRQHGGRDHAVEVAVIVDAQGFGRGHGAESSPSPRWIPRSGCSGRGQRRNWRSPMIQTRIRHFLLLVLLLASAARAADENELVRRYHDLGATALAAGKPAEARESWLRV